MKNVNTLSLLALKKAIDTEVSKRTKETPVPVGEHTVSTKLEFEVSGTIQQCKDESYTPTVDIPLKVTLALFVRYSGITGQNALNALEKAMTEALKAGEKAEENISEIADVEKSMEKVVKMLGELPRKTRKGKCNVKATAEGSEPSNNDEADAAE